MEESKKRAEVEEKTAEKPAPKAKPEKTAAEKSQANAVEKGGPKAVEKVNPRPAEKAAPRPAVNGQKAQDGQKAVLKVGYGKAEVEKLMEELVKKGESKSKIGILLRDQYGIPSSKKIVGKKVGKFLEEQKLSHEIPEDLQSMIKKSVKLSKHLGKNRGDLASRRAAQVNESKIRRLAKYYKKKKKLPKNWKFGAKQAELLVE